MYTLESIIVLVIIILCLFMFYYLTINSKKQEKYESQKEKTTDIIKTEEKPTVISEFGNDFDDGITVTENASEIPSTLMKNEQKRINALADHEVNEEIIKHSDKTMDQFMDNMTNAHLKLQNRENLLSGGFHDSLNAGQFFEMNENMPLRKYRENWNLMQNDKNNAYRLRGVGTSDKGNFWQALDGMEYSISQNGGDEPEEVNRNILGCFDQSLSGNY